MPYDEDNLIPISSLQHYVFCKRQCALIHLEQAWSENRFTAEGRLMHEKAHSGESETRGSIRVARSLPLRSRALGLVGIADIVEFHRQEDGCELPFPIEYKRGKPKQNNCDRAQLCAQALCLEEMLGVSVPQGALFYGKNRRRHPVAFDAALRQETARLCEAVRNLLLQETTPPPEPGPKCRSCSLVDDCMPEQVTRAASRYIDRNIRETIA